MTGDRVQLLRAGTLGVWAVTFGVLWVTGAERLVGPRTAWVVPVGFTGLSLLAVILARTAARAPARRASRGELLGGLLLVLPAVAILTVPDAQLGALAAQRRADAGAALVVPDAPRAGPLDLLDVALARQDDDYAAYRGVRPGSRAVLVGLVSARSGRGFAVTRFQIVCCAADAVPVTVPVVGARGPARDRWVRVVGRVTPALAVRARTVREIPRPEDPYIS